MEGGLPVQVDRVSDDFDFPMGPFAMAKWRDEGIALNFALIGINWTPAAEHGESMAIGKLRSGGPFVGPLVGHLVEEKLRWI